MEIVKQINSKRKGLKFEKTCVYCLKSFEKFTVMNGHRAMCGIGPKRRKEIARLAGSTPKTKAGWAKGKTYDQIYGKRAEEKKKKMSSSMKKQWKVRDRKAFSQKMEETVVIKRQGKTYEEIYGKDKAEEMKKKMSKARQGKMYEEMFKDINKADHVKKEKSKRMSRSGNPMFGKRLSDEACAIKSQKMKQKWTEEEFIQKQMTARDRRPNNAEWYLNKLLQEWLPEQFKYVGDFSFLIGGKNPDFTNVNGKKQVIELFGDYWHGAEVTGKSREDEILDRVKHFAKFGLRCLVIWESEFNDVQKLKQKVFDFVQG